MSVVLKQGELAVLHFGSLINKSTGARIVSGAAARTCIDGTWGDAGGTLALEETDQNKYTLSSGEAAARNLVIAIDHTDAVEPIVESFTLVTDSIWSAIVSGTGKLVVVSDFLPKCVMGA